uniref:Uncharacterized protein n=1 Tax=Rhizophora mucronata TaxID=61149 RepID=A0A2P2N4I8_RHIMU
MKELFNSFLELDVILAYKETHASFYFFYLAKGAISAHRSQKKCPRIGDYFWHRTQRMTVTGMHIKSQLSLYNQKELSRLHFTLNSHQIRSLEHLNDIWILKINRRFCADIH